MATTRRKKKLISRLTSGTKAITDPIEIEKVILQHFKQLYAIGIYNV